MAKKKAVTKKKVATKKKITKNASITSNLQRRQEPQARTEPSPVPGEVPATVYVSFSAEINVNTAERLLGVLAQQLTKGTKRIHLLLSTKGGQVDAGMNLYNVMRGMPFELITHNVGSVNSIGNVIFLAGETRYACPHSTFRFHGAGIDVPAATRLEERLLRKRMDTILSGQEKIGSIIQERTTLSHDAISELFLEAETKDAIYARTNGIVHDICDVKIPPGAPVLQLVFKR